MLNGTLGDSQIFLVFLWSWKGTTTYESRSPAWHAKPEPVELGSTTSFAELFKVKFRYIWELGRRFSRSIQEFLMLFGFHDKSDF